MAVLTSVDTVKAYLGLGNTSNPAQDALLAELVKRASAAVESFCQRSFMLGPRTEWRDGNGGQVMLLRDTPVVSVEAVIMDDQSIPVESVRLTGRCIRLREHAFRTGVSNVRIDYTAGFDALPADVEQAVIETVALNFRRRDHLDVASKALAGETVSYLIDELTPSARRILSNYRVIAPF